MAQFGKASSQRGKPSYFMSILGVTIVLFLLGIVGWLTINSQKLIEYFKESVEIQVFLKPNIADSARQNLQNYIASQPYTRNIKFTDKETAKKEWIQSGGEDFTEFLDNSLLPTSIDFTLKADYVDSARIVSIRETIGSFPIVDEVKYPNAVVGKMQRNFNLINLVLASVALLIAVLVIILIDNTIRLAMFSNRFLIKTMQMVGATRWFITKPLNVRAVVNGAISAVIAIIMVYAVVLLAEHFLPDLKALRDTGLLMLMFVALIVIGITITLFSTYRSALKYLRMKLDELY
ncbi:MAG TPA: permease-like cell division protein FtsX [Chitinophagaceae bacterium]|jgi:cell division transport system permease protein|nr:permease-like cell division protein FtsX [Chitinophagaceae bacterium]